MKRVLTPHHNSRIHSILLNWNISRPALGTGALCHTQSRSVIASSNSGIKVTSPDTLRFLTTRRRNYNFMEQSRLVISSRRAYARPATKSNKTINTVVHDEPGALSPSSTPSAAPAPRTIVDNRPHTLLIDNSCLIYRAYHSMKATNLSNSQGQPTHAVYGYTRSLLKILQDFKDSQYIGTLQPFTSLSK